MIPASPFDKEYILKVLENAFKDNPTLTVFSRSKNGKENIRPILEYAFYYSMSRKGVFLSDDKSCVAFFNRSTVNGGLIEKWFLIKLVFTCFNLRKIASICSYLKKIKEFKPKKSEYYHFWFLGSEGGTVKSTRRFMLEIFDMAFHANIPIYAETTLRKNESVYSRYGFEKYAVVNSEDLGLSVSLMRREFY